MTRTLQSLAAIGRDIKLSHSVFALPFALLATFLAAGRFPGWTLLGLIVACMFFARTFAMLANRYFDRDIDARNPRTAGRALPAGRLTPASVRTAMVFSAAFFLLFAAFFGILDDNWWPLLLAPAVLLWLGAYGLMKRWTLLCHFFLGIALAISPLAAGVAIYPPYLFQRPVLWWLAGFVMLWVAGFDIIYALQDVEVDQREGLHSIPARLGRTNALLTAKAVHLLALLCLVLAYRTSPQLSGPLFWGDFTVDRGLFSWGILLVAALLIIEHRAATRGRFSMAFFTLNGIISLMLGAMGILDVLK